MKCAPKFINDGSVEAGVKEEEEEEEEEDAATEEELSVGAPVRVISLVMASS